MKAALKPDLFQPDSELALFFLEGARVGGVSSPTSRIDADDRFIYKAGSRSLYCDQDGNGAAAKALVAALDKPHALAAADMILF
ncbi:hypothetical protein MesoLjLb_23150 [Mesorhizobium sp. L-8-3]|nr:hypothetical protein MesoLjLb_23150 [Mesorhizobium sp. L-8-3]